MIVEVLEMHQTWLTDGTHGAQALINTVTRNAQHAAPPVLVDVFSEMEDEATATEQGIPAHAPCLGMTAEIVGEAPDAVLNQMGDGLAQVTMRYLCREPNAKIARRNAAYSARGILASLRTLAAGGQEAARSLRGVQLITRTKLEFMTLYQPLGDGFVSGLIQATYIYRDAGFLP